MKTKRAELHKLFLGHASTHDLIEFFLLNLPLKSFFESLVCLEAFSDSLTNQITQSLFINLESSVKWHKVSFIVYQILLSCLFTF